MRKEKTLRTRGKPSKFLEEDLIQEALSLKHLRGSVVFERVACGKQQCSVCNGKQLVHGPYAYLHYWDASTHTVKRKYVTRNVAGLLVLSTEQLQQRLTVLHDTCPKTLVLGQDKVESPPLFQTERKGLQKSEVVIGNC